MLSSSVSVGVGRLQKQAELCTQYYGTVLEPNIVIVIAPNGPAQAVNPASFISLQFVALTYADFDSLP